MHDAWIDQLFFHRLATPPPGYAKVSIAQMVNADRALFTKVAELTRNGIVPDAAGVRPMDTAIAAAMVHASVTFLLMPLPMAAASQTNKRQGDVDDAKGKGKGKDKKPKKEKGKGKGKDKGKGKGAPKAGMPSDLAGMVAVTPDGKTLCFNFNRGTCTNAVSNGKCQRGYHLCCKPGCGGNHPMGSCNA